MSCDNTLTFVCLPESIFFHISVVSTLSFSSVLYRCFCCYVDCDAALELYLIVVFKDMVAVFSMSIGKRVVMFLYEFSLKICFHLVDIWVQQILTDDLGPATFDW